MLAVIRSQDILPGCKVFRVDGTLGLWDGFVETLGMCPEDHQWGGSGISKAQAEGEGVSLN